MCSFVETLTEIQHSAKSWKVTAVIQALVTKIFKQPAHFVDKMLITNKNRNIGKIMKRIKTSAISIRQNI